VAEPAPSESAQPAEPAPAKGTQLLAQAVKSYEDGDYRSTSVQLQAALKETLSASEKASAHKYLAFIACAAKRPAACRDEFRKALASDPAFELTPAEAGHPTWGPAFKRVKAEATAAKANPKAKAKRAP
jgi:Tfp pilus assembly protein PilF